MKIILYNHKNSQWLSFTNAVEIITCNSTENLLENLRYIESRVNNEHLYAAGYIAYEAAPAFDPALKVRTGGEQPLLCFGLYKEPEIITLKPTTDDNFHFSDWHSDMPQKDYLEAVRQIKEHIANGSTYQVNYTFRLSSQFSGSAWQLFSQLAHSFQGYQAYIEDEKRIICSASPELFFTLDGNKLETRPMKGTIHRGLALVDDEKQANELKNSIKDRAENVMIVDMARNDMGRIAETGSVKVTRLYDIEKYPTVWQMTSTVECETAADITDIFTALFPCASITGAPKIKTSQIIAELEKSPRGVYTGAIGYIAPGRKARFNVAIRTVVMDKSTGYAEYGIGSGIVWDSDDTDEFKECLLKAKSIQSPVPDFSLLESMLWEPGNGYFLLERHLDRLLKSAKYFGYPFNIEMAGNRLDEYEQILTVKSKVRLLVNSRGIITINHFEIPDNYKTNIRAVIAAAPIDMSTPYLYHKTTHRQIYNDVLAAHPGYDDVILHNEKGEITETCAANIVAKIKGVFYTPPVSCGLLAGTFREELLANGEIREKVITRDELLNADEVYLINSVRKWVKIRI